jgi:hypothetical protein
MFAKKLAPILLVFLWLLIPQGVSAAERISVVKGDTLSWISRKVTGSDLSYLNKDQIKWYREGKLQEIQDVKQLNKIFPGRDEFEFEVSDAHRVTVPQQELSKVCSGYKVDQTACEAELLFRNRIPTVQTVVSSLYIPNSYQAKVVTPSSNSGGTGNGSKEEGDKNKAANNQPVPSDKVIVIVLFVALLVMSQLVAQQLAYWIKPALLRRQTQIPSISTFIYKTYLSWQLTSQSLLDRFRRWRTPLTQRLWTRPSGLYERIRNYTRSRSKNERVISAEELLRREEHMRTYAELYVQNFRDCYSQINEPMFTTRFEFCPRSLTCDITFVPISEPEKGSTWPFPAGTKFEEHYQQVKDIFQQQRPEYQPRLTDFNHVLGDAPETTIRFQFNHEEVASSDNINSNRIVNIPERLGESTLSIH